jgi:cytochrome c
MTLHQGPVSMIEQRRKDSGMKRLTAAGAALVVCLVFSANGWAADVAIGKAMFEKTCANCHSTEAGVNKVGPTLFDIVGRPVASVQGYDYSKKMRA